MSRRELWLFQSGFKLTVAQLADQVVDYMRNEKKEQVDREDVILLWLTENIMGQRSDRARMDPL